MKECLFTITAKHCRWDYYKGSGKGGQKRNKTENCVRCTHIASGAVGKSEEGRSKERNKRLAFRKMAESEKFKVWQRLEVAKITGELSRIKEKIDKELSDHKITKVEYYNPDVS